MRIFSVLSGFEPEAFFEDGLDKIGVVALADVDLEGLLVFGDVQLAIDTVYEIDHEEKLSELVDLMVN